MHKPGLNEIEPYPTTVFFWVGFAKAKGYEWADAFEYNVEQHTQAMREQGISCDEYNTRNMPNLGFAIARGFTWQLTPEGADYWLDVYRSIGGAMNAEKKP